MRARVLAALRSVFISWVEVLGKVELTDGNGMPVYIPDLPDERTYEVLEADIFPAEWSAQFPMPSEDAG